MACPDCTCKRAHPRTDAEVDLAEARFNAAFDQRGQHIGTQTNVTPLRLSSNNAVRPGEEPLSK